MWLHDGKIDDFTIVIFIILRDVWCAGRLAARQSHSETGIVVGRIARDFLPDKWGELGDLGAFRREFHLGDRHWPGTCEVVNFPCQTAEWHDVTGLLYDIPFAGGAQHLACVVGRNLIFPFVAGYPLCDSFHGEESSVVEQAHTHRPLFASGDISLCYMSGCGGQLFVGVVGDDKLPFDFFCHLGEFSWRFFRRFAGEWINE